MQDIPGGPFLSHSTQHNTESAALQILTCRRLQWETKHSTSAAFPWALWTVSLALSLSHYPSRSDPSILATFCSEQLEGEPATGHHKQSVQPRQSITHDAKAQTTNLGGEVHFEKRSWSSLQQALVELLHAVDDIHGSLQPPEQHSTGQGPARHGPPASCARLLHRTTETWPSDLAAARQSPTLP